MQPSLGRHSFPPWLGNNSLGFWEHLSSWRLGSSHLCWLQWRQWGSWIQARRLTYIEGNIEARCQLLLQLFISPCLVTWCSMDDPRLVLSDAFNGHDWQHPKGPTWNHHPPKRPSACFPELSPYQTATLLVSWSSIQLSYATGSSLVVVVVPAFKIMCLTIQSIRKYRQMQTKGEWGWGRTRWKSTTYWCVFLEDYAV